MASKKKPIDSRVDYSLILPVFFLVLIGLFSVYTATIHDYPSKIMVVMGQQLIWLIMGAAISFVVMLFSTEFLWKITPYLYGLGLILMIFPLIFYSPELVASTGAKNWVSIGSVTLFQPSEFMKISYILILARLTVTFKQKYKEKNLQEDGKLLLWFALLTLPIMILLALQKDLGTAMVFMAILAGLVLIAGISWQIILPVVGAVALIVALFMVVFLIPGGKEFLYHHMGVDTYQINRLSAWLNPFDYAGSIAYQQTQGMISIGSGGLFGKGFNIVELPVPVRESDMIFTVIAENFGFIGGSIVLALYLILIYRMLRVTFASNNLFYTYISTGFIMMILFHIFENIGAAVGILPLTGIPLPFISQGGSSLISNLIGVGLVLSMSYQNSLNQEKATERYFAHIKKESLTS
ncbi:FtsW/RodA/SpoVE family cell cycle protein [Streptococcus mutans]|jgi:putative cell division protein|uniref:Cell division protein (Cell shape determining protein) n=4 Tax=Streptococcus TaxID=1301 RepID=Q8CWX3_STRMU|nr:FtsW/RodA/SpoVE family cell cycle protein [Streptococcus mutans]EMB78943.1 putative cell division protein [Streptococcus mutans 11VS1]RKV63856.1 MAG: FtsW/RodA/SpoVE family cell cycle protein [Streptococcus sp.]AAN58959.1 putative cell division protein (cell shape determining protein) [Streptococcus mutans UA159]AJD55591.1 cell shape determining protein [Streptococcus mutans UA159-FR]AMF85228.1 rod shape-determining protein RodA [Streptococcus mutans]